jgi:hypothetical protein
MMPGTTRDFETEPETDEEDNSVMDWLPGVVMQTMEVS